MKTLTYLLAASAVLSFTASNFQPASAQSPDAEITALISQVAQSYRDMKSLSCTIESSQGATFKSTTKLLIKKPNLVKATITIGAETKHFVVDGTNLYVDSTKDAKRFVKGPSADFKTSINGLAQNGGTGVGLLPILLMSSKAESEMIPGKPTSLKKLADASVGPDNCDVVQAIMGSGDRESAYTFSFGKADHLLRRVTVGSTKHGSELSVNETYSEVNTNPSVTDDTFKYTIAAGATSVAPPKEPVYFDERLKPGFTPFPLKGVDLTGKPVSYANYKGKVLLVDFWATWCGPCVAELPNVIAAYSKYHSKGFEVLGISLDQPNSKPLLLKFMKEHKMPWPQIYDGKAWQSANATAYKVQAIPFTLLVGKNGKIAAVGARGGDLAPAIEKALKAN